MTLMAIDASSIRTSMTGTIHGLVLVFSLLTSVQSRSSSLFVSEGRLRKDSALSRTYCGGYAISFSEISGSSMLSASVWGVE